MAIGICIRPESRSTVIPASVRDTLAELDEVIDLSADQIRDGHPSLESIDVLVSGWGTPSLDAAVLARMPKLRFVAHAAGSVRPIVTDHLWRRGIRVSSAVAANARPVVDFTLAQIQLALKNTWRLTFGGRFGTEPRPPAPGSVRGADGATIGLIGLGHIGLMVADGLRDRDVRVLAYDPFCTEPPDGVHLVDLPDLMAASDVASVHAPLIDATRGMIDAALLRRMPADSTLINTARGAVIDTGDLVAVMRERDDLVALLDVTDPEPLPPEHPLLALDNVYITPHIAGSLGTEEARLGALAASEVAAYLRGESLGHEVLEKNLSRSA